MSCPDDNELWARAHGELSGSERTRADDHLDGCTACRAALGALTRLRAPAPRAPAVRGRGATLGRYVIVEAIGAGGMGVVYRAFDPELGREVALKLVRTVGTYAQARLRERLTREARLLARISHPNVVAIHDVGIVDEEVFLTMELVAGPTLAAWQAAAPRRWQQVLDLYLQAARGLAKAHEHGIVHRDFKASNALLGSDDRVRVVDFGLAGTDDDMALGTGRRDQAPRDRHASAAGLSGNEALLGTPAYMAPEQRRGRPADARSDQYSLCVALREALLAQTPGLRPSASRRGRTTAPGPISGEARAIPRWLRRVLQRGLMVDPAARWPDMHALISACERGLRRSRGRVTLAVTAGVALGMLALGGRLGASSPSPQCQGAAAELAGLWDADRKAAIAGRFAAAGLGYATTTWTTAAAALDAYASAWTRAHTRICEATRLHGHQSETDLSQRMHCLDDRRAELHQTVELLARADRDVVEGAVTLAYALPDPTACVLRTGDDTVDRHDPSVRHVRGRIAEAATLVRAARYAAARTALAAPLSIAERRGWQGLRADGETVLGEALEHLGEPAAAEDALYRAVWAAEAARDDARTVRAWTRLAPLLAQKLARPREARRAVGHARAAYARHGVEPVMALELARGEAVVAIAEGRFAAGRNILAAALATSPLAADDPRRIAALRDHGVSEFELGDHAAAAANYRRALAIAEPRLGAEHPEVADLRNNLGGVLLAVDDLDGAEAEQHRALAIHQASLGPDHASTAASLGNLANILVMRGQLELAAQHYRDAQAIFAALPNSHPDEARTAYNFGACLLRLQDPDGALRSFQRAAEVQRRTLGAAHPDLALYLIGVGAAQDERGAPAEAIAPLEEAIAILLATPRDPIYLAEARFELARALWSSRRDRPRARALARQAAASFDELAGGQRFRVEVEAWLADLRP